MKYDFLNTLLSTNGYSSDEAHFIIVDYLMGKHAVKTGNEPSYFEQKALDLIGSLNK